MRTWSPAFCTLPSRAYLTPNSRPTSCTFGDLPLYAKVEFRSMAKRSRSRERIGDKILSDAVVEVLLLRVAAQVGEGHHRDRRNVRQRHRRLRRSKNRGLYSL